MNPNISRRLQDLIDRTLRGTEQAVFVPSCIFHNPDTEFRLVARYVKDITILQDFVGSYSDNIQMAIDLRLDEFRQLLDNMQGLLATVVLQPYDHDKSSICYSQAPISIDGKVFIDSQQDIEKMFGATVMDEENPSTPTQASTNYTFQFHLLEPKEYACRHVQFNMMSHGITMQAVLVWIAQQLNLDDARIVTPDNQESYDNFIIPPMQDISTIFSLLQERYGVYSKGMGYYITNKTLYVYPAYDPEYEGESDEGVIHLINAPELYYMGLKHYHHKVDNDVYVVSPTKAKVEPLNTAGAENLGTLHLSTNADSVLDRFAAVDKKGRLNRSKDDITSIGANNSAANMASGIQNTKYLGNRTNIYQSTSEMAKTDGTKLQTGWLRAMPRIFRPGQKVVYHFDAKGGNYKTQKGILQRVVYSGHLEPSDTEKPWLTFDCFMDIHLEADKSVDPTPQTIQANSYL